MALLATAPLVAALPVAASVKIWQVNLVNRIDRGGALRDLIDRRIERTFGYPERRTDADAGPRPSARKAVR